jgi:hypothetical protein
MNNAKSLEAKDDTCNARQDLISIAPEFLERLLQCAIATRRSLLAALKCPETASKSCTAALALQDGLIDQLKDELLKF